MNILDFVLKIDNVIPDQVCDEFVQLFEDADEKELLDREGFPKWTHLHLSNHYMSLHKKVEIISWKVLIRYKEYLGEYGNYFNSKNFDFEGSIIKRYLSSNGDHYGIHADVSTLSTCKRFITFLYYLNDDFEGGETVFYPDCKVKPKKGSVLVFPSFWCFPHEAHEITEGKKYILSTYCNWSV